MNSRLLWKGLAISKCLQLLKNKLLSMKSLFKSLNFNFDVISIYANLIPRSNQNPHIYLYFTQLHHSCSSYHHSCSSHQLIYIYMCSTNRQTSFAFALFSVSKWCWIYAIRQHNYHVVRISLYGQDTRFSPWRAGFDPRMRNFFIFNTKQACMHYN